MKLHHFINLLFCLFLGLFISACSKKTEERAADATVVADSASIEAADATNAQTAENEKLGTKWGDDVTSNVSSVELTRLSVNPIAQASVRYANKQYQGKAVNSLSVASGVISFTVLDDQAKPLPLVRDGKNYFLKAKDGQSYQLQYENHSDKSFEIVASVDGLDVLTGQEASKYASGYVLGPHRTLNIEGFRKSDSAVASFTFGQPDEAYAANSSQGSIDNTGIIGTVIFEVEPLEPVEAVADTADAYAPAPNAFPGDKKN
ncbi:hypothetical protein [Acinetobacter sp. TGL-Y2]|uniref:hypothetical protein n=1 Tax=Acinetobacter sp. TGL-Y2 TaxID=1407071 RepID=UPI000A58CBD0